MACAARGEAGTRAPTARRRRSCATLGELLFYVVTQSKEGSQASAPVWAVPGNVFGVLVRCLRDNEDVVAHSAAKAIEIFDQFEQSKYSGATPGAAG